MGLSIAIPSIKAAVISGQGWIPQPGILADGRAGKTSRIDAKRHGRATAVYSGRESTLNVENTKEIRMLKMFLNVACGAAVTTYATLAASADAWPSNPIKLVVTFPAGGSTDVAARLVDLGRPVLVDNKPGAGGNIGADFVAKAPADGYTLLMATSSHVTNRTLYKSLPYDFLQDLAPVSRIAFVPNMLVVNPSSIHANNLAEFIKLVKDPNNKSRLNYGSGGNGTSHHLATALFNALLGVEMEHVPYKGGAPAAAALLGGQVQVLFAPLVEVQAFIDAGKLKALGVTTKQRSSLYPDIPAIGEVVTGYEVALWNGILVPAATATDIVGKLNGAIARALAQADIKQRLAEQGSEPAATSPAEFRQFIAAEVGKWAKLVQISGAKVD
jgi:tripartite-type tricarboxylate transporter receptor subunit TctC